MHVNVVLVCVCEGEREGDRGVGGVVVAGGGEETLDPALGM